jgi:hypothetical protein
VLIMKDLHPFAHRLEAMQEAFWEASACLGDDELAAFYNDLLVAAEAEFPGFGAWLDGLDKSPSADEHDL